MDRISAAGKAEYPIPVFTNTWIVQPEDKVPGDYPSGGPELDVRDIWRAGAPHIDINAPDVYLPNFNQWVALFNENGNPLFVPESRGDVGGAANAVYAIGRHASIGVLAVWNRQPRAPDHPAPRTRPGGAGHAERPAAAQGLRRSEAACIPSLLRKPRPRGPSSAVSLTGDHPKEDL